MTFEDAAMALAGKLYSILGKPASSKMFVDLPCHSLTGIDSLITQKAPETARPCPDNACEAKLEAIAQFQSDLIIIAQTQGLITRSQLDGDALFSERFLQIEKPAVQWIAGFIVNDFL